MPTTRARQQARQAPYGNVETRHVSPYRERLARTCCSPVASWVCRRHPRPRGDLAVPQQRRLRPLPAPDAPPLPALSSPASAAPPATSVLWNAFGRMMKMCFPLRDVGRTEATVSHTTHMDTCHRATNSNETKNPRKKHTLSNTSHAQLPTNQRAEPK